MKSSWWKGTSEKKFIRSEERMLHYFDVPEGHLQPPRNVYLDDDMIDYVRTIEVGDKKKNLQKMVLVHGYGGSGIMFWKIIKPLAEKYHLYLIDILGMGGSSRRK
jgi:pimeloyl-ACP methyl ester carboxylesterase